VTAVALVAAAACLVAPETVSVELVIQPEIPVLPFVAIVGAFGAVAAVSVAAWRRRAGSSPGVAG